jgi:predicted nucleic acid-binding protein
MSVPVFIDTNILVYADDQSDPAKRERAQELIRRSIRDGSARLSLQVLQEYFVVATRKLSMDADAARLASRSTAVCTSSDSTPPIC